MKLAVIIPAAGSSRRYSEGQEFPRSKLDEELGGRPVLQRTVEMFTNHEAVALVVVAGPADAGAFAEFKNRHGDKLGLMGARLVPGGAARWQSVKAALAAVSPEFTHVAVHDAARPCTPPELLDRVFEAAAKYEAVVPAIDVPDTLKRVGEREQDDAEIDPLDAILGDAGRRNTRVRRVEATVDRARLVAVQTPQVFQAGLLRRAYERAGLEADPPTDDAAAVERLGGAVVVIEGDPRNVKITRPVDLNVARALIGAKGPEGRAAHKRF